MNVSKNFNSTVIVGLCHAFGWLLIGNENMLSFKKEEVGGRLNIYHTMTVTYQYPSGQQRHYRDMTIEDLEKLLTKIDSYEAQGQGETGSSATE